MLPGFTVNLGAQLVQQVIAGGGGGAGVPSGAINILVAGNESTSVGASVLSKMISLSSSVGYPTVSGLNVCVTGDLAATYSATGYDVILWWNDYSQGTNTYATINNFLAAGKGVIFLVFGHCYNEPYASLTGGASATQISTNGGFAGYNTAGTLSGGTTPITYQVTGVGPNQGYSNSGFTTVNSALTDGTWSGSANMMIYKNASVGTSRRVDLNFWPGSTWTSEASNTNAARLLLNACFWAARKTG